MTTLSLDFETRPHDEQLNVELQVLRERKKDGEITQEEWRLLHKQAVNNSLERMIKRYAN